MPEITGKLSMQQKVLAIRAANRSEVEGVYSLQDLAAAEVKMQTSILDRLMSEGVRIVDPRTTTVGVEARIGPGTVVHPHTVIEGPCEIGRGCSLGPFARIREGVTLGEGVCLGDFVEVVRSRIGARTKIKHLAFIGDAEIEADVTIGGGVITANSDGTEKHRTLIGRKAYIGCGTILVAPVNVGSRATTGAGAVVLKDHDVPEGETVVGVPAQAILREALTGGNS
jgi:bifunctional UDP-N-acetylglucosamine pyrophosphorylase/glucosamine-1-phosphate N-acetyltransferase